MRIAVFIKKTTFHKGFGGLETQNKSLCEGLAERGYDITVFSPQNELEFNKKTEHGVDYVFIKCTFRTLFSKFIKDHWYNKSYEEFCDYNKKQPFDLVLSQSSAGLGILLNKRYLQVPVITISHGSTLMEYLTFLQNINSFKEVLKIIPNTGYFLYNLFFKQKYLIKNSTLIITVSNFVKKILSFETMTPKNKFIVIHNGINPESLLEVKNIYSTKKSLDPVEYPNLLYLGQIQKSKGLDYLIKIAEDPRFSNVHIDVVGSGDYLDEFKNLVIQKGVGTMFTIHGKVDYSKIGDFYGNAYAFLFPTNRYEGFPMVLVEASFYGLPIIAFNKGGVADSIKNNFNGYLVRCGNINKFKQVLSNLLQDPKLRNEFGTNALEKAREEFTIDSMLNKYENVFERFIK